jgi:hypothetical protein
MTAKIGRPVVFEEARREKFCILVGVGVTRRHAAISVGVDPSTVSRHMEADPLFAEQVRDAENDCEIDLLKRVRLQSERSWRACVWLLERMRPERYARGKSAAAAAPSWDEMFDKFIALIDAEVGDAALRERLTARLDAMALEELAAQQLDDAIAVAKMGSASRAPAAAPQAQAANELDCKAHEAKAESRDAMARDVQQAGVQSQAPARQAVAAGPSVQNSQSAAASRVQTKRMEKPAGRRSTATLPGSLLADLCNTPPDAQERRLLERLCSQ